MFCKIVLPSNEIHKLASVPKSFEDLKQLCQNKFKNKIPVHPCFKYKDSDEELIILTNDEDLETAILTSQEENVKTLRIFILPGEDPSKLENPPDNNKKIPQQEEDAANKTNIKKGNFEGIPLTESGEFPKHIVSEPVRNDTEEEELRKLSEAINANLGGMRRSISQPAKKEKDDSYSNPGSHMRKGGIFDFQIPSAFNEDQTNVLAELIERKVKQIVEFKIQALANDIINYATEEIKKKKPTTPMVSIPKIMSPSPNIRPPLSRLREPESIVFSCNNCGRKIEGIRYICTVCKNFDYCETCENKGDHPHAFLKIRPPAKSPDSVAAESDYTSMTYPPGGKIKNMFQAGPKIQNNSGVSLSNASNLSNSNTPFVTPHHKDKRYSAKITKEPIYDVIKTKTRKPYTVVFAVKNSGDCKWPDDVRLICVSGVHNGTEEKIPALDPGKEYSVALNLVAPDDAGKYVSQWRLHHGEQPEGLKAFGSNLFFEIHVVEDKSVKKEEIILQQDDHMKDDEAIIMKETKCTKAVLEKAKVLHDLFPSDGLKEKIEFVMNCPISLSLDDLVEQYMELISGRRKSMHKNVKKGDS